MSKKYIEKHVDEIVKDDKYEFPLNMAMGTVWILGNLKGINLKVISVKEKSSLTDYFVLASSSNTVLSRSMADEIITQMKRCGMKLLSQEGKNDADWILLDFGDIIVHIFLESKRDIYNFDELWSDSESIDIPHEYYFSSEDEGLEASSETSKNSYF